MCVCVCLCVWIETDLQGDREELLGLPISPLCDRKNTHVAQSQIGQYHWTQHAFFSS